MKTLQEIYDKLCKEADETMLPTKPQEYFICVGCGNGILSELIDYCPACGAKK